MKTTLIILLILLAIGTFAFIETLEPSKAKLYRDASEIDEAQANYCAELGYAKHQEKETIDCFKELIARK